MMVINDTFDFWNNLFAFFGISVSVIIAYKIHKLSTKLSLRDKYQKEKEITKDIKKLKLKDEVLLTNVKKYHPPHKIVTHETYSKNLKIQYYEIAKGYGIYFIIKRPRTSKKLLGLVPFEWIEYIRLEGEVQDSRPTIICEFKGLNSSPFKELHTCDQEAHHNEVTNCLSLHYVHHPYYDAIDEFQKKKNKSNSINKFLIWVQSFNKIFKKKIVNNKEKDL